MACDRLADDARKKRKASCAFTTGDEQQKLKQPKLDLSSIPLTQNMADQYIVDYVIDSILPMHMVDTPPFKLLVQRLTGGRVVPRCRQTVTKQLEERFVQRTSDLKTKLRELQVVCTTADCWSSRHRSFLGITVHWIEPDTLDRKGACLAVRQLTGSHTYAVLAQKMESINDEFGLQNKICYTVTDSGSNFIKAFRHFSMEEAEETPSELTDANGEGPDSDEIEYMAIEPILQQTDHFTGNEVEDSPVYRLPRHWRCACHALNLVATADVAKLESGPFKRASVQTFAKLTAVWNKQNRSTLAADTIRAQLGTLLVTPGDTRWNSVYDAVSKVYKILSVPEEEAKFDKICDDLKITRLLPVQKTFINEYVRAMKPIACGLDILQSEKSIGLGYLLPTLAVITGQLDEMLEDSAHAPTLVEPLVRGLKAGITRRFGEMISSTDAQLAAVVTPQFKFYWIEDEAQKARLLGTLKARVRAISNDVHKPDSTAATAASVAQSIQSGDESGNFFASICARRQRQDADKNDVDEEVNKYMSDTSSELSSLSAYPNVKKLYLKLNTGLPASAAVERLFSVGGRIFSPLRAKMSSEHFEMLAFLRLARW